MCIKYYLLSSSEHTFNKEFMVHLFESYLGLEHRYINNEFIEKENELNNLISNDIKVRDHSLLDMNIENINLVQRLDAEIIEKVLYRKPNLIYRNILRKAVEAKMKILENNLAITNRFWFDVYNSKEKDEFGIPQPQGRVQLSFELVPAEAA
jgi:hypothetical protein